MNQGYFGKSKTIVVFHSNFLHRVLILNTSNHAVSSQKREFCILNASQSIKTHGCELNL